MPAKDVIEIELRLKKAEESIRKMNKLKKSSEGVKEGFNKMKLAALAVGGVLTGVVVRGLGKLGAQYAKFSQSMQAAEKQFGKSGDEIIKKLKEVSDNTISNADLIQSANKAMALNVTTDLDQMAKLLEVARIRGQAMGVDTTQAFEDIVTGIGRASPLILDNLGIITKGWAEEARAAGGAFDAQFILNKVLEDGANIIERAGGVTLTNAERLQQFTAAMSNLGLKVGKVVLPIMTKFAGVISTFLTDQENLVEVTEQLINANKEYSEITDILTTKSKELTLAEESKLKVRQAELQLKFNDYLNKINKQLGFERENLEEMVPVQKFLLKQRTKEINTVNQYQRVLDDLNRKITKYADKESLVADLTKQRTDLLVGMNVATGKLKETNDTLLFSQEQIAKSTDFITQAEINLAIAIRDGNVSKAQLLGIDKDLLTAAIELSKTIKTETKETEVNTKATIENNEAKKETVDVNQNIAKGLANTGIRQLQQVGSTISTVSDNMKTVKDDTSAASAKFSGIVGIITSIIDLVSLLSTSFGKLTKSPFFKNIGKIISALKGGISGLVVAIRDSDKAYEEATRNMISLATQLEAEAIQRSIALVERTRQTAQELAQIESDAIMESLIAQHGYTALLKQEEDERFRNMSDSEKKKYLLKKDLDAKILAEEERLEAEKIAIDEAAAAAKLVYEEELFGINKKIRIQETMMSMLSALAAAEEIMGKSDKEAAQTAIKSGYDDILSSINSLSFPAFAKGGSMVTDGPQMFLAGDNPSGRERVTVQPLNESTNNDNRNININVQASDPIQFVNELKQVYGLEVFE